MTSAVAHDSRPFEGLLDPKNTASKVWAEPLKVPTMRSVVGIAAEGDTAYRSAKNKAAMAKRGRVSMVHFRKPKGRSLPANHARANAARSVVRSNH